MKNIKRIIVLSSLLSGALMVPVVVPHLNASSDVFEFKDGEQIEALKIKKNAILLSPYTIESLRTLLQDQLNEIKDMQQKEYLYVRLHGQLLEVSTEQGHYSNKDKVDELIKKINTSIEEKIRQYESLIKALDYFSENHPFLLAEKLRQEDKSNMSQWGRYYRDEFQQHQEKTPKKSIQNHKAKNIGLDNSIELNFLAAINDQAGRKRFENYFLNNSIQKILDIINNIDHVEFDDPTTPRYPDPETPSIVDWERACRFLLRYIYHENTNRDLMDNHRLSIEELYPLLSRVPVQIGMDPRHTAVATSIYKSHMSGQVQGDLYPQSLKKIGFMALLLGSTQNL